MSFSDTAAAAAAADAYGAVNTPESTTGAMSLCKMEEFYQSKKREREKRERHLFLGFCLVYI